MSETTNDIPMTQKERAAVLLERVKTLMEEVENDRAKSYLDAAAVFLAKAKTWI